MTTLAQANLMLAQYIAAEEGVLLGKEVRLGVSGGGIDRMMRMEDLPEIRKGRQEWERRVSELSATAAGAPKFGGIRYSLASFGPD